MYIAAVTSMPASYQIVVSGYPPLKAQTFFVDGRPVVTVAGSVYLALVPDVWHRCGSCNGPMFPGVVPDGRLGVPMCRRCVEYHQPVCQARHGRLPAEHEFFCLGCVEIKTRVQLCRPDADGRRRWRCQPCRTQQVWEAEQRRKERRKNVG